MSATEFMAAIKGENNIACNNSTHKTITKMFFNRLVGPI
jgi:hypothetical protein